MENNTTNNGGNEKKNMAAEMFKAFLDSKKITYESSMPNEIYTSFVISDSTSAKTGIYINFDESETHVDILAGNFISVTDKEKYNDIFRLLNRINGDWRWVKFYMLEDTGKIYASVDAVIQLDSCVEEVHELISRLLNVLEKVYPEIMKTVWS